MINLDEFIKENVIYYDSSYDINKVLDDLVNKKWSIIAMRDSFIVKKYKKICMLHGDIITNIKARGSLLFYIIDNIEYPIRDDTRIATFLSPFKNVYLKTISDNKNTEITFTRLLLSDDIKNKLRNKTVIDKHFIYQDGCING